MFYQIFKAELRGNFLTIQPPEVQFYFSLCIKQQCRHLWFRAICVFSKLATQHEKTQAISHHASDNCIFRHALDIHNFTQHAFRNISSCYLKGGNCKVVTDKNFFHVARLGIVASYRTIPRTRVHFNRLEKMQSNVQKVSQVSSTPNVSC